jgi:hypothetical protein
MKHAPIEKYFEERILLVNTLEVIKNTSLTVNQRIELVRILAHHLNEHAFSSELIQYQDDVSSILKDYRLISLKEKEYSAWSNRQWRRIYGEDEDEIS